MTDKLLIDRELVDKLVGILDDDWAGMHKLRDQLRNLPTARFLDLEGVERWEPVNIIDGFEWQVMPDGEWVSFSDLTNAVVPGIGREELVPTVELAAKLGIAVVALERIASKAWVFDEIDADYYRKLANDALGVLTNGRGGV